MAEIKWCKGTNPNTGQKGYILLEDYVYFSKRYNRSKSLFQPMWSDGATSFVDLGADNIMSRLFAWCRNRIHHMKGNKQTAWFFVHDAFCNDGEWDGGEKISNWDASTVAGDILWAAGYRFWSIPIWWATWLFGGGAARKNGMWRVKTTTL